MDDLITRLRERAALARGRSKATDEIGVVADVHLDMSEADELRLGLPLVVEAAHHANLALDLEAAAKALERLKILQQAAVDGEHMAYCASASGDDDHLLGFPCDCALGRLRDALKEVSR